MRKNLSQPRPETVHVMPLKATVSASVLSMVTSDCARGSRLETSSCVASSIETGPLAMLLPMLYMPEVILALHAKTSVGMVLVQKQSGAQSLPHRYL